jgi:hypothetical protein
MRLLRLPLTVARLPLEIAVRAGGAAFGVARTAFEAVAGRGDEARAYAPARPGQARNGGPVTRPATARPAPVVVPPEPVVVPPEPADVEPEPADVAPEPLHPPPEPLDFPVEPIDVPPEPEPEHVSEEPELVAEFAEPGAEDGAGAEVSVEEPWPGYDRMTAAEIRRRLPGEPPEVAAAVTLYEAARKGRSSVLEAGGRRMRAGTS